MHPFRKPVPSAAPAHADALQCLQGVYGLVSNLGSLVVRLLFQPFEEAAFLAFSRSAGAITAKSTEAPRQDRTGAHVGLLVQSGLLCCTWWMFERCIRLLGLASCTYAWYVLSHARRPQVVSCSSQEAAWLDPSSLNAESYLQLARRLWTAAEQERSRARAWLKRCGCWASWSRASCSWVGEASSPVSRSLR